MKKTELQAWLEDIFRINPAYANILGTGTTGIMRTSVGSLGSTNSAADIIQHLRHAASEFARAQTQPTNAAASDTAQQAVEGDLLTLAALGNITQEYCDTLIERLHILAE